MKISWPVGLVVVCSLFIGGIAVCITIAVRNREALVSTDYYDQEIRYQQRIDAIKRTQDQGAIPVIAYDETAKAVTLNFATPASVQSATGTVTLYRPSDATLDHSVAFAPDAAGRQIIASTLAAGFWRVKAEWFRDGQTFYAEQAIKAP